MTGEPIPIRDNGPYRDQGQARAQFAATTHGIPTPSTEELAAQLGAQLLAAGEPSR